MGFSRKHSPQNIPQRTSGELEAMAAAGQIVAQALRAVQNAAHPGISTLELDQIAETTIRDAGAVPSFLGYHGFPASICSSLNDRVVHGIPTATEILADGDLVSIDCGAILDGWHGDSAITFGIGQLDLPSQAVLEVTYQAMQAGIAAMVEGNHLGDISYAIASTVNAAQQSFPYTFGIVAGYGGHGIGSEMHMDPFVPNSGLPGRGPLLTPGVVLAIEPMVSLGTTKTRTLKDGWTVVTKDGSRAAHWEHTVAVTNTGPRILTLLPE